MFSITFLRLFIIRLISFRHNNLMAQNCKLIIFLNESIIFKNQFLLNLLQSRQNNGLKIFGQHVE